MTITLAKNVTSSHAYLFQLFIFLMMIDYNYNSKLTN